MKKLTLTSILILSLIFSSLSQNLSNPKIDATINVETGHYWSIAEAAFSPDGKFVATINTTNLIIWNYKTKHEIMTFRAQSSKETGKYISLAYSNDGKIIAVGSSNGEIILFDLDKKTKSKTIKIKNYNGKTLSYSKNGKYIAVGVKENIELIDVSTGSVIKTFTGHTKNINNVVFSHDCKKLASTSSDYTELGFLCCRRKTPLCQRYDA